MQRIVDGKNKNIIGDKLYKIRLQKGFTQKDLSDRLELLGVYVCRGSVSRIENHTRSVTDIEIYAISKVLKVKITELFEGGD